MAISDKTKAISAAAILAGSIGLVSIGSSALFTDTVTAESTFKAGTADIQIQADSPWEVSADRQKATLGGTQLIKSSAAEITVPLNDSNLTVWNKGDIPVTFAPTAEATGDLKIDVSFVRTGGDNGGGNVVQPGQYVQYRVTVGNKDKPLGNDASGKTAQVTFKVNATA
ncbi:SipW-dependent-type signal peptide-containing protein [Streptomyces sp. NPDC001443]